MADYSKAPNEVLIVASGLIKKHYPDLQDAAIGFLMRDKAPESNGRITYGAAKKIGDLEREYMDYDFVIWLAEDKYYMLDSAQREALIDHELMHCMFDAERGKAKIRQHDVEEFAAIIKRHGLWWPGANDVKEALYQLPMFESAGKVEAVPLDGPDVLDQLDDLDFA